MIQTNVYPIENLSELNCKYQLYKVSGISRNASDYDKNVQQLIQVLGRESRSPCVIVKEADTIYVAQPSGSKELPSSVPLVGIQVQITKTSMERELRFDNLQGNDANIAKSFLQFYLQDPLYKSPGLWLPRSGAPFFQKSPDQYFRNLSNDVDMCKGFKFRIVILPDKRIGICVDVSRKYISRHTLPTKISEDDFRKYYKFKKCVYEYGNTWYEVRIEGLHDQNVSQIVMPDDKSLFDHVHEKAGQYKSEILHALPKDSTVLIYHTPEGAPRHIPSGLCRFTYKTNHPSVKRLHSKAIMNPHKRKTEIEFVVQHYFKNIRFQDKQIVLSHNPYEFDDNMLDIPELKFGNNVVLSTTQNTNNVFFPIDDLGRGKQNLLQSLKAGFYVKKNLDAQYIVLPQSVYASYGKKLVEDIIRQTNVMYHQPNGKQYDPTIIKYDDSVEKSIPKLGHAIIEAVKTNFAFSGYGLVIIPRLPSTRYSKEDELANLVMRELRKRGIFVSVMHTDIPYRSYTRVDGKEGSTWQIVDDQKMASRFRGYLSNVVLNKIMILNSCWPFVLAGTLNADLIVGIDVKNNTAGFTIVYKDQTITFHHNESDQKEQLGKRQLEAKIYQFIKEEQGRKKHPIRHIVIHRDGRMYQNEIDGIKNALAKLSAENLIDKNYESNFVAIRKHSSIPVRFFKTYTKYGEQFQRIDNPKIGTYQIFDEQAFLCTTGIPYDYPGTTSPLQIVKVEGNMDFNSILQDIFWLSNLTWTKIDYCSKLPISIKITDIRLREIAGEYNEDALEFSSVEEEPDE